MNREEAKKIDELFDEIGTHTLNELAKLHVISRNVFENWQVNNIKLFSRGYEVFHGNELRGNPNFDLLPSRYELKAPRRRVDPMKAIQNGGLHKEFEFFTKIEKWLPGFLIGIKRNAVSEGGNIMFQYTGGNWENVSKMRFKEGDEIVEEWLMEDE